MKILSIFIHNLQSLKGENFINFEDEVLANAGLYAITGPTGAGKTTILDAITLAIYNKTNRHNAAIKEELITRNTKECVVEVTFNSNNENFMVRWTVDFNRNNKLNEIKRSLFIKGLNNELELVAEGITRVQAAIEKILPLSYEQFTKSVLLAQNNFSAFLKAQPAERAEMLSKITGTEIYEQISKNVFEKYSAIKQELEILEKQKKGDLLTEEEIVSIENKIQTNTNLLEGYRAELKAITEQINWYTEVNKTDKEVKQNEIKLAEIEAEFKSNSIQFDLLNDFNKAQGAAISLHNFDNCTERIDVITKDLAENNSIITDSKQKLEIFSAQAENKNHLFAQIEEELEVKSPVIEQVKKYQTEIAEKEKTLIEAQKYIADSKIKAKELAKIKEQNANTFNNNALKIKDLELVFQDLVQVGEWETQKPLYGAIYKQIEKATPVFENLKNHNFKEEQSNIGIQINSLENEIKIQSTEFELVESNVQQLNLQKNKLGNLQELSIKKEHLNIELGYWNVLAEFLPKKIGLIQDQENFEKNNILYQEQKNDSVNLLQQIDKQYKLLKDNQLLQKSIASLDKHREELEDGKACPLCGSNHHPFADEKPHFSIDETANEIAQTEIQISEIQKTISAYEKNIASTDANLQTVKNQIIDSENTIQKSVQNLKFEQEIDENVIKNHTQVIQNSLNEIVSKIAELNEINLKLDTENSKLSSISKKLNESKLLLNTLISNAKAIEEKMIATEKQALELEASISDNYKEISKIIVNFGLELTVLSLEEIVKIGKLMGEQFEIFKQNNHQLTTLKEKQQTLSNELDKLDIQINANTIELQKLLEKEKNINLDLNNIENEIVQLTATFVDKNPENEEKRIRNTSRNLQDEINIINTNITRLESIVSEKTQAVKQLAAELEKCNADLEKYNLELNKAIQETDFKNITALRNSLLLENSKDLAAKKQTLDATLLETKGVLSAAQEKLNVLKESGFENIDLDNLQTQKHNIEKSQTVLNQEIGSFSEQLRKNRQEQENNQKLVIEIKTKGAEFVKWEQLNQLIGSKTGDNFKKFAQDFTLSLLIQHANKHLKIMFDRYELYKDDNSKEMELQIADKHFFGEVRNINSLSGGETFLVSLSLALGLSDLASKNTPIRSLFIDEGFGTLDPESLNNALDTLELLRQSQNRQIGIISHVEELKKRITTQIQVNKYSPEFSKITVVN